MPIFNEEGTLPLSTFYSAPDYEKSPLKRSMLAMLGYKANGETNAWGKFNRFLGQGIINNIVADKLASGDTKDNIKEELPNALNGTRATLGLVQSVLNPTSLLTGGGGASTDKTSQPTGSPTDSAAKQDTSNIEAGSVTSKIGDSKNNIMEKKSNFKLSTNGLENIIGGVSGLIAGTGTSPTANDRKLSYLKYMNRGGIMNKDGGVVVYSKDSKQEDLHMIDKKTGLKVGEMRYGERILSQRSSIVVEELANNGDYEALGKYVAQKVSEQDSRCVECGKTNQDCICGEGEDDDKEEDMMKNGGKFSRFANGGPVRALKGYKTIPSEDYMRLPEYADSLSQDKLSSLFGDVSGLKDSNGMIDKNKLIASVSDGVIGDITSRLAADYYNNKPISKPQYNPTTTDINLSGGYPNDTEIKLADNGLIKPTNNPALTNDLSVINDKAALAKKVDSSPSAVSSTDILNDGYNVFGALIAASQGRQGLPSWTLPKDYMNNLARLKTESFNGLTDAEKSYASEMTDKTYDKNVQAIRNTVGGGGSSGAILGALVSANESRYDSNIKTLLADISQRDVNQANYSAELGNYVGYDRQQFQDQYAQDSARLSAASTTLNKNLQAIADRRDYNRLYGKGSSYDRLQGMILANAELSNAVLMSKLKSNTSNVDTSSLSEADKSILKGK